MDGAVPETAHNDFDGNTLLRNRELVGKRTYHDAGHVECRGDLFTPRTLLLIQMIEHPYAHCESAVLLDDMRVEPGKFGVRRVAEEFHRLPM